MLPVAFATPPECRLHFFIACSLPYWSPPSCASCAVLLAACVPQFLWLLLFLLKLQHIAPVFLYRASARTCSHNPAGHQRTLSSCEPRAALCICHASRARSLRPGLCQHGHCHQHGPHRSQGRPVVGQALGMPPRQLPCPCQGYTASSSGISRLLKESTRRSQRLH